MTVEMIWVLLTVGAAGVLALQLEQRNRKALQKQPVPIPVRIKHR